MDSQASTQHKLKYILYINAIYGWFFPVCKNTVSETGQFTYQICDALVKPRNRQCKS